MAKPKLPPGAAKVRLPTDDELRWITTRAVAEIIPEQEFVAALRSGRRLRLKMGFDPTRPIITLGWAVGLRKLRQLQDLGHQVVVIIGDWTARIGDPSGESQTRPMLSEEEVRANAEAILRQFYKVLDPDRTEIRRQSEWFGDFTLADVVRLAARFTVAQMLQRDDFAKRYAAHRPIGIHELLYPLLQAHDSVAVQADVEFGGTDQKFNILVGRELQPTLGQRAQSVLLVPLLVGLDGQQKMSQSLGNYIGIEDPPHDMYGKIMSISDDLMLDYYELLTNVPEDELTGIRRSLKKRTVNPMESKMRLAREIVGWLHGPEAAQEAQEQFDITFRVRTPKGVPTTIDIAIPLPEGAADMPVSFGGKAWKVESLPQLLHDSGFTPSLSESRRLVRQGSVKHIGSVTGATASGKARATASGKARASVSGKARATASGKARATASGKARASASRRAAQSEDETYSRHAPRPLLNVRTQLKDGMVIRVGKNRFLRIVDADKQSQPDNE